MSESKKPPKTSSAKRGPLYFSKKNKETKKVAVLAPTNSRATAPNIPLTELIKVLAPKQTAPSYKAYLTDEVKSALIKTILPMGLNLGALYYAKRVFFPKDSEKNVGMYYPRSRVANPTMLYPYSPNTGNYNNGIRLRG